MSRRDGRDSHAAATLTILSSSPYSHAIYYVSRTGYMTRVAGTGVAGYSGDDG